MGARLKIIPLLIVVAMLAFSVRLVEVVSGVRDISGSAVAASDMEETAAPAMQENDDDNENMSDSAKVEEREEPVDWRDSTEADIGVSTVKMEMFEDLANRRQELEKRERMLVTREALLRAAEQELERKYQEMAALRKEIESLLEDQSEEEKQRIESLVKIYEGMKAKDAARIFDTLDTDVLVNVMSKMSERKIAPIMAAMNPERARNITILLAEQRSLPEIPEN